MSARRASPPRSKQRASLDGHESNASRQQAAEKPTDDRPPSELADKHEHDDGSAHPLPTLKPEHADFLFSSAIDGIVLGTPDAPGVFPIFASSAKVVRGSTHSVCPNAEPTLPVAFLPKVVASFERLNLIPPGHALHWTGDQKTIGSVCTCFDPADGAPGSASATDGPQQPEHGARPLTVQQQRVFDHIKAHQPIKGRPIVDAGLCACESTLTRHIIPALKGRGVRNMRGAGYYVEP